MVAQKRKIILIDSDAWVALAKTGDTNHVAATKTLEKLERMSVKLITTNYIFTESVTVISQRVNHETALQYISLIKKPWSALSLIWISESLESEAIDVFKQQTSKNVSFVDCTNMAIMDSLEIDSIFSFDKIYEKKGYVLATDL